MKFILEGTPIPYARPRVTKTHTYNPKQQEKEDAYWDLWNQYREYNKDKLFYPRPLERPLQVLFSFFMPVPKSWSKIKQSEMLGRPHISKPDADNLLKFYLDAGINSIWRDDSIVSNISARKVYDLRPRTEITVVEIL